MGRSVGTPLGELTSLDALNRHTKYRTSGVGRQSSRLFSSRGALVQASESERERDVRGSRAFLGDWGAGYVGRPL